MADVSKIKLPDGTTYNIKDTVSGYITTVPVTSVNEQTGDVTITEGLEPLIGTTSTVTPQQVMTALEEGRDICITATASVLIVMLSIDMSVKFTAFTRVTDIPNSGQGIDVVVSQAIVKYNNAYVVIDLCGGIIGGESKAWTVDSNYLATSDALESVQNSIPTSVSQLTNDSGFITNETESDPTVPSWAKASTKPTYTASEVGAVPTSRTINGKALSNDITLDASDIGINPASVAPNMDGTAAVGTSSKYAREDHVHPTDTSRQADLGLTSADVKKWNDAITLNQGNIEYSISGSEIVTDPTLGVELLELKDSGGVHLLTGVGLATVNNVVAQTYVPKTTTVNGNALSDNITLDADDVSAIPASAKGAASGVAPLDANSKVDSQYLPSYLIKGNTGGVFYGTCSTAAGTVAKVVECADFTSDNLKAGAIIIVSFTTTNSGAVASLTMNVNGTGAKPIKYINNGTLGNLSSAGYLKANVEYPFYYDGTNWVVWFNVNSTYSALSEADMKAGTATSGRLITAARLKQAVEYHAPVTSVNGNTGDVTVTVPTKTSELTNDIGYITSSELEDAFANAHMFATDATSQAVLSQAFGISAIIRVPSDITTMMLLLYYLEPRTWFAWMNGTTLEFSRLSLSVDTSNSATTLYLRGRTSIATGIMGVDSSWTVTDILPIYDGGVS